MPTLVAALSRQKLFEGNQFRDNLVLIFPAENYSLPGERQ